MSEINFARQRVRQLGKQAKLDLRAFRVIAIVTSSLFTIFLVAFGISFYLNSQMKQVKAAQQSVMARIGSQEELEKSYLIFINKLGVLKEIFSGRQGKQEAIEYFSQVFGPEVTIAQMAYDANSKLLAFNLQAKDVFTLDQVFEVLDSEQTKGLFSTLQKSGIQRTDAGFYRVQISIVLNEKGLDEN